MMNHRVIYSLLAGMTCAVSAEVERTSATYRLGQEVTGDSGGRVSGGTYTSDLSVGAHGGGSSSATYQNKSGYTGRLSDVQNLVVTASPTSVNEGATTQLSGTAELDDLTTSHLDAEDVLWSVPDSQDPIASIDASGLATAAIVFEDRSATVQGEVDGTSATTDVTVLNVGLDDYGDYAGDGIDDDWQFLYFGEPPNADGLAGENPDSDPDDNLAEFLGGFNPLDASDFFQARVIDRSGGVANIELNKVIPDRIYTLTAGTDLIQFPQNVTSFSVLSEAADHVVQDPAAVEPKKFYRVEIERP